VKKVVKKRAVRGRPTLYTIALRDKVCAYVSQGLSWRKICQKPGMPQNTTLSRWLHDYPDFREHYAYARAARAEDMVGRIEELIDELNDKAVTGVKVSAVANQIQAFKWLCSHFYPKMYAEKMQVEHSSAPKKRRYDYSRFTDKELEIFRKLCEKALVADDDD